MSETEVILDVRNLSVQFITPAGLLRRRVVKAVDDVSLQLRRGESLGLVGESGSGKTTLSRAVVKLTRPTSGTVLFEGEEIVRQSRRTREGYRKRVQMIFQDPYESLNPRASVKHAVEEPMLVHHMFKDKTEREQRVSELLKTVGLNPLTVVNKYPHELSGGERQRVSLARALSLNPELLIADEPVSMLDVSVRIGILNLMLELKQRFNLTCLFITHDLGVARYFCDRIAVMYRGKIVEMGETESLLHSPMHPYTKLLVDSVPGRSLNREEEGKTALFPMTEDPSGGCNFNPRCPYAREVCRTTSPPLLEVKRGKLVACHFPLNGGAADSTED